jgi:hypothetical protein
MDMYIGQNPTDETTSSTPLMNSNHSLRSLKLELIMETTRKTRKSSPPEKGLRLVKEETPLPDATILLFPKRPLQIDTNRPSNEIA